MVAFAVTIFLSALLLFQIQPLIARFILLGSAAPLVVRVSNLHFDLKPVVRALAESLGKQALWIEDFGSSHEQASCCWQAGRVIFCGPTITATN